MNLPDPVSPVCRPLRPVPRFSGTLALAALAVCVLAGCGDKGATQAQAKKSAPAVPVLTATVVEKRMPANVVITITVTITP